MLIAKNMKIEVIEVRDINTVVETEGTIRVD